ncbi:hypothetical protein FI667_g12969, partial [Globisporangium splendens]
MHKLLSTLLFLVLAPVLVLAQNKYPIVLVHGFSGWGRDELLGLKYWGGIQGDLQEQLKAQGYTVYTASVGPFSSNWDRAIELYTQIKGGQADYGAKHSTTHGHTRKGRTYPGLYPEWGNVVNGKVNKIHLIGHSMGGQTVRMLAQLLAKGSAGAPIVEDASSHPLFAGGKDWIHSITTISTPNQGTTLANGFSGIGDAVKDLLAGVFSVLNIGGSTTEMIYDAKLDQWGLSAKQSGESLGDYIKRIFKSPIFNPGFKDVCLWSLSTQGAAEESTWVQTLPNIYYYSYATVDTHAGVDASAATSWQANDGVVPLISQSKDSTGSLVVFGGSSQIGKWNQMPQLDRMDHLAVVGITLHTQIKDLYVAHAQLLASLPEAAATSSARSLVATDANTTALSNAAALSVISAVAALKNAAAEMTTKEDLEKLCANPINTYAKNYCSTMINNAGTATRRLRG